MHRSALLVASCLAACGSQASDPEDGCDDRPRGPRVDWFEDVTSSSGVDHTYTTTGFKGGALVVADLDGDDRPDIVAATRTGPTSVFRNRGDLRFERSTTSGIPAEAGATSAAAIDLDNDGDRDLVLAGADRATIFANDGSGTFTVAAELTGTGNTEHVLPVDLDRDGRLDLYFSNYDVMTGALAQDRVLLQRGDLSTFVMSSLPGADLSWTAGAFDVDGDGDLDLHVSNDTLIADHGVPPDVAPPWKGDKLLRNDGLAADGTPILTDIATEVGLATPRSSMSSVLGDLDENGELDLFVTDWGPNKVFARTPGGGFLDQASVLGLAPAQRANDYCDRYPTTDDCLLLSWSMVTGDFDHDGGDDLIVLNGGNGAGDTPPVQLFSRGADGVFAELTPNIACMDGRGLVASDLDGDGDQDLVLAPINGPLRVVQTRGAPPTSSSWLRVLLHGTSSNREGAGAVLRAHLASGRVLARTVGASGTLHTALPAEAWLALGDDAITRIDVQWPSGVTSQREGPATGTVIIDEP